jgi:hypothetical protein
VAGDGERTYLMEKAGAMAETNLRPEEEGVWGRRHMGVERVFKEHSSFCFKKKKKSTAVSRPKINLFLADFDCFATNCLLNQCFIAWLAWCRAGKVHHTIYYVQLMMNTGFTKPMEAPPPVS